MTHPGGRPPLWTTVEDIEPLAEAYFRECEEKQKPPTITGLALALNTNRQTLINYEEKDEFFDTIKRYKSRCEQWVEENALMNKANATFSIFNLKNNYGWKDKTEQDVTSGGEKIAVSGFLYNNPNDQEPK